MIVRGLRVRFEAGPRGRDRRRRERRGAARRRPSSTRAPPGSARSRSSTATAAIGPLGTVFYDTLLDENAASHLALGNGFPFAVGEDDRRGSNDSATHIDFMVGSPELEVTGVTAAGERVPVLRGGDWQI